MHMKTKYTLFRHAGVFYSQGGATGKQTTLRTKDETKALTLLMGSEKRSAALLRRGVAKPHFAWLTGMVSRRDKNGMGNCWRTYQ